MNDAAEHVRLARRVRPAAILGTLAGSILILQFFFELSSPWPEGKHVEPSPVAMALGLFLAASGGWMWARFSRWATLLAASTLAWGGLWLVLPAPGESWRLTLYTAVGLGMWLLAADQIRHYALYRRCVRARPDPQAVRSIERALALAPAARFTSNGRAWTVHLNPDLAVLEQAEGGDLIAGTAFNLIRGSISVGERTLPCDIDEENLSILQRWISSK